MAVQYLESLDSVRTTREAGGSEGGVADLQTFLEVVMALALGREVVVPQSYAFDSGAFLRVAEMVLNARGQANPESKDRPFRPHLHKVTSFDAALVSMISRVPDEEQPFHSSLHPRLNHLDQGGIEELVQDLDAGLTEVAGDEFAGPLAQVRAEFRVTRALAVRGPATGLSLGTFLQEFGTPTSALSRRADGLLGTQRDTYLRLVAAVRKLGPEHPAAFGQRSRLRQAVAWPNDARGRSAAELVGDDDIPLVVEFVDTLYNRQIVDSMGAPLALYSTATSSEDAVLDSRLLAQEFALGRPPLLASDHAEVPPYFRIEQLRAGTRRSARISDEVDALFRRGSKALVPLMAERSDRAGDFWQRIGRIEQAAAAGDQRAYEQAVQVHLEKVTKKIGGEIQFTWKSDLGVDVGVKFGEEMANLFNPTGVVGLMLQVGFFAGSYAIKGSVKSVRKRGARRRMTAALSSVVPPLPGGPQ